MGSCYIPNESDNRQVVILMVFKQIFDSNGFYESIGLKINLLL